MPIREKIDLFKPLMSPDVSSDLQNVIQSGYIGQGSRVDTFEDMLREELHEEHVVTVNSCTSALQLALHLAVGDMTEGTILLPPLSCFATVSAALTTNLELSWVDIDPETLLIDFDALESKLNADTKVVIVVHLFGLFADMNRLYMILERHQQKYGFMPLVIEDCAQLFGTIEASEKSRSIKCYSFQAVKMLTTIDGGALVLPDSEMEGRAKKLRWYGLDRSLPLERQDITESGWKYHMNDINAQVGISNLTCIQKYDMLNSQRFRYIEAKMETRNFIESPSIDDGMVPFHPCSNQFPVMVKNRDQFISNMKSIGIESSPAHYRCDKHSCVKRFRDDNLPGMDLVEKEMTSVPIGWWLTQNQFQYVIDALKGKVEFSWQEEGF